MQAVNGDSGGNHLKRFDYKVPGGKLLCAKVETEGDTVSFIQFTGDFFLLPETDLEDLERQLMGINTNPDTITEKIVCFFKDRNTVIAGAKPEDFAFVLNNALK
jgi:lipoate---protein ligase